ncbi:hypothetical protein LBMAG42_56000 [Deltaproteobacteria bacterium]|nr:hypothetical protein LBMAG42_56000 [Deltaproteobacteria bacterium]
MTMRIYGLLYWLRAKVDAILRNLRGDSTDAAVDSITARITHQVVEALERRITRTEVGVFGANSAYVDLADADARLLAPRRDELERTIGDRASVRSAELGFDTPIKITLRKAAGATPVPVGRPRVTAVYRRSVSPPLLDPSTRVLPRPPS